ncbi:MAG: hypothetical protein AB7S44_01955 [Spirochaetales bacterium]
MENKKRVSLASKIIKITLLAILAAMVLTIGIGYAVGYRALIVDGVSMEPIILYRSLAIDKKMAPEDVKIGDIITYTGSAGGFITHQLIRVRTTEGDVVAEFRDYDAYDASWDENGAYYIFMPEYGTDVVAWYSGTAFTEDMLYVTQGTNYTVNPFDGSPDGSGLGITYDRVYGIVKASIPYVGDVVFFIQDNIILVIITFAAIFLLYNMIMSDVNKNKELIQKQTEEQENKSDEESKNDNES